MYTNTLLTKKNKRTKENHNAEYTLKREKRKSLNP